MRPRRDQETVQTARRAHPTQRVSRGSPDGQPAVTPELAENDRRKTHERTDRKIDAAAGDHRRQGHRQEANLDAEAKHLERVGQRQEVGADQGRRPRSRAPGDRENCLSRLEPKPGGMPSASRFERVCVAGMSASLPVERIGGNRQQDDQPLDGFLPLGLACHEPSWQLVPRKTRAGPIEPSKATPIRLPINVPRPPETATPPTTTAAMTWSSRPGPELGSTSAKRTAFSSAARPARAPSPRRRRRRRAAAGCPPGGRPRGLSPSRTRLCPAAR